MTFRTGNNRNRAFLLVEVVLTGVVMAVGVVMISRSLATPLHALTQLQERETLLRLADSTLAMLESRVMVHPPLASRHGVLDPPHERYEWMVPMTDASDGVEQRLPDECRAVTLTVREVARPASQVTLTSLWPREWVEE